ncbi:MAG: VTT domain-containing protein, partial [Bacteroidota bacterium]
MELLNQLIDLILHIDQHLADLVGTYHSMIYAILALIIFCETGLVFTPFLPGDSLLFAAGALAAGNTGLEITLLIPLLFLAAVAGDSTNYFIGKTIGEKLLSAKRSFIRKDYLQKTHDFYSKHGGKTVVLARFMPILRTFAPFVAGLGSMVYRKFLSFSVLGNVIWISLFT